MGKLDEYLSAIAGYFRHEKENEFPWDTRHKTVWYALLVIENNRIEKYGFTSSCSQTACLCQALKEIENKSQAMLLGIWTGKYSTHLFVLDIDKAIEQLQ